jgi:hypothetical protein
MPKASTRICNTYSVRHGPVVRVVGLITVPARAVVKVYLRINEQHCTIRKLDNAVFVRPATWGEMPKKLSLFGATAC